MTVLIIIAFYCLGFLLGQAVSKLKDRDSYAGVIILDEKDKSYLKFDSEISMKGKKRVWFRVRRIHSKGGDNNGVY